MPFPSCKFIKQKKTPICWFDLNLNCPWYTKSTRLVYSIHKMDINQFNCLIKFINLFLFDFYSDLIKSYYIFFFFFIPLLFDLLYFCESFDNLKTMFIRSNSNYYFIIIIGKIYIFFSVIIRLVQTIRYTYVYIYRTLILIPIILFHLHTKYNQKSWQHDSIFLCQLIRENGQWLSKKKYV